MSHEDLTISSNSFDKIARSITNAGFREGVTAGKDKSFQTGFDVGYEEGFRTGQTLGYKKGLLFAPNGEPFLLLSKNPHPETDRMLGKAHAGLCVVCKEESTALDSTDEGTDEIVRTLADTVEKQRSETEKSLHLINATYADQLKKLGAESNISNPVPH